MLSYNIFNGKIVIEITIRFCPHLAKRNFNAKGGSLNLTNNKGFYVF